MSTYTPIASVTLSSAQATVDFVGIPQTYTDLVLVVSAGNASSGPSVQVRFNGDTASNYSWTTLSGGGTSALSDKNSSQTTAILSYFGVPYTTLGAQTQVTHLMNYSNTAVNKVFLTRASNHQFGTDALVGLWRSNSAITSINLYNSNSTNFVAGSTFNLYGIADAGVTNVAKAIGGDIVTTDGTYWYHGFLASGTFTPTQNITSDILVIAGGGSGGNGGNAGGAGGGGAGGLLVHTSQSLTVQNYTVTVGAGGAGVSLTGGDGLKGNNGSNSQFGSLTASVGGGAGGGARSGDKTTYAPGNSGGSGGGSSQWNATGADIPGGTATSGQGNNGGALTGLNGTSRGGAGGGGASAVGASVAVYGAGAGGAGSSAYSSWASATNTGVSGSYAGGGGGSAVAIAGGSGGSGGGGAGLSGSVNSGTAVSGTANTGSGGGGAGGADSGQLRTSGAGGSGIVIVRYAV